jgi:hypothetical protein
MRRAGGDAQPGVVDRSATASGRSPNAADVIERMFAAAWDTSPALRISMV